MRFREGHIEMNKIRNCQAVFIILIALLGVNVASAGELMRVWAYQGPEDYVGRGKVKITDRHGRIVAKALTNDGGLATFVLKDKIGEGPYRVTVKGGKVNNHRFNGTLATTVEGFDPRHRVIFVDLITTAATKLYNKNRSMSREGAKDMVRYSLSIPSKAVEDVIRLPNRYVNMERLKRKMVESHGFDRFVNKLVVAAKNQKKIEGLQQPRWGSSQTVATPVGGASDRAIKKPKASVRSSATVCAPASNASESTNEPSQYNVDNIASITVASMLEVAGLPGASVDGITGMLLSPLGASTSSSAEVTEQYVEEVLNEVNCLTQEINDLTVITLSESITEDMQAAQSCADSLTSNWSEYQAVMQAATTGPNPTPISYSNVALAGGNGVTGDITLWDNTVNSCGQAIYNGLFGTPGSAPGAEAWPAYMSLMQTTNNWYTQYAMQGVQAFADYWISSLMYQYVLQNEVWNWTANWSDQAILSGSANQANPSSTTPGGPGCAYDTAYVYSSGAVSLTYCAQFSNLAAIYPPNIYSDEVALLSTDASSSDGIAVNPYPGLNVASAYTSTGLSTTSLNAYSLGNNYLVDGGALDVGAPKWYWYAATFVTDAIQTFNGNGINPGDLPSGVETYDNPQVARTLSPTSTMLSALLEPNCNTDANDTVANSCVSSCGSTTTGSCQQQVDISSYFLTAINQVSSSGWGSLTTDQIGFYTTDNATQGGNNYDGGIIPSSVKIGIYFYSFLGNTEAVIYCDPYSLDTSTGPCVAPAINSGSFAFPVMGAIMGRTWWPNGLGLISATYNSSAFPPPLSVASVPGSVEAISSDQPGITLQFALSSTNSSSPITGYTATCSPTSGVGQAVTGFATTSPVTVASAVGGVEYSCVVQSQTAGGNSPPSVAVTATAVDPAVPNPPVLTYVYYNDGGLVLEFYGSTYSGTSSITGYQVNCTDSTGTVITELTNSNNTTAEGNELLSVFENVSGSAPLTCSVQAINTSGLSSPSNSMVSVSSYPYD